MSACTSCGHGPLTGRFCPACGYRATPATPPPPPPPPAGVPASGTVPPPARFPLYADETPAATARDVVATQVPVAPSRHKVSADSAWLQGVDHTAERPPLPPPGSHAGDRRGPDPLVWIIGVAVVVCFAVIGGLLLFAGGAGERPTPRAADPATHLGATGPTTGSTDDRQDPDPADSPSAPGSPAVLVPDDVDVPGAAPSSRDNDGKRVSFTSDNLVDERPDTCWRVAGDASGKTISFRFDDPVVITEVGLINGYAKQDPPNDWYAANRRVLEVEWIFDDGTTVSQTLEDGNQEMQRIAVDPVVTSVVELRIVNVSTPGGRDFTPISEVVLVGAPE